MKATKLRNILIFFVIVALAAGGGVFYLSKQWLTTYSVQVSNSVAQVESSGNTATSLANLKVALVSQQDVINLAKNIASSSTSWQSQAIKDLGLYASAAGLSITGYNSVAGSSDTIGVNTEKLSINITSPASYEGVLKFMKLIQTNAPKMYVESVTLSRVAGDSSAVNVKAMEIGVYVR